jgi:hypothetical protein
MWCCAVGAKEDRWKKSIYLAKELKKHLKKSESSRR